MDADATLLGSLPTSAYPTDAALVPGTRTLVVTEGRGWVQLDGDARRDMRSGDVVWIPPETRHWHGATATSAMTHLALQGEVGGSVVSWLEHVSDAQYLGAAE